MRGVLTACHNRSFFILFLLNMRLALIFTYHWKSANFSDVHFLQVFQCKPTKQTLRNYGKTPWHGTNSVWSIRKSNICRRFDEMLLDIPKSEFLSRFELLVRNPGLKRNNELINLTIGMTGSMQQFWFTVLENGWKGLPIRWTESIDVSNFALWDIFDGFPHNIRNECLLKWVVRSGLLSLYPLYQRSRWPMMTLLLLVLQQ